MTDETGHQAKPGVPAPRRPVKLTVELEADLHHRLKIHCAVEGTTIADVVRELLRERLLSW